MNPSEQYLKPETNLGDATLQLSVHGKERQHFVCEIFDLKPVTQENGVVLKVPHAPYSLKAANFVERRFKHGYRILNRQNIYHPIYEVPVSDYTVQLIQHAWKNPKIISPTAQPFFNAIFKREWNADLNANRSAQWRETKIAPTNWWFDSHDTELAQRGITLNSYQKTAAFNACHSKAYGLFCDPGTGKTCMMIRKLDFVIDHAGRETISLILCPKNVRTNWRNELEKFSCRYDKLYITNLQGNSGVDRMIRLVEQMTSPEAQGKHIVIICGYEAFVQTKQLHDLEWDLVLVDESQNLANPGTKRTKTLLENREKFKNVMIATGTPFRNSPFDIYAQFEVLEHGLSGFTSLNAFKQFYGEYAQGYNGKISLKSFKNLPLMQERISKHCFVIRKEEALPFLPKKLGPELHECNLTKEMATVYDNLAAALYAEIEGYGDDVDSVTVNNILTKLLRLAQVTSGFVTTDSGAINRFDPNPKLELLVKFLLGCDDDDWVLPGTLTDPNAKTIIWCCFKPNIAQVRARLDLEGISTVVFHGDLNTDQRDEAVQKFNCDPSVRCFIGTQASGGVGLNLVGFDPYHPEKFTTNTTDVCYYSSNYSYVLHAQSQDRAHRYITRCPVTISHLLAADSIDGDIFNRLKWKKEMDMSLQDIRGILKGLITKKVATNGN